MFLGGNRCLVPLVLTLFINASTRFVYYACIGPLWSSIFYAEYIATVQYRKWSPTANDPETANDPQNGLQMILDRKWSPKLTANDPVKTWGMEWILWDKLQKRTDYKKRNFFLAPSKEKGKEDASSQVNLYKAKKK